MDSKILFPDGPSDGREKILQAVYEVIISKGYEGISMQQVADAAGVSKATVYHHFEGKEDLMLAFTEIASSRFGDRLTKRHTDDPVERLQVVADRFILGRVSPKAPEDLEPGELGENDPLRAFVEIRAHAVHEPSDRPRIGSVDEHIIESLTKSISEGVEDGSFRDTDIDRAANRLYTLMLGGLFRRTTTDNADLKAISENVHELIDDLSRQ